MVQGALVGGAVGVSGAIVSTVDDDEPERSRRNRGIHPTGGGRSRSVDRSTRVRPQGRWSASPSGGGAGRPVAGQDTGLQPTLRLSMFDMSPRRQATSPTVIAALPVETLTADSLSNLAEDRRECCICMRNFQTGQHATRLPCMTHLYHTECINRWLRESNKCPKCNEEVDKEDVG
ncbi:unnamed protein product [Pylaiella littoralis]